MRLTTESFPHPVRTAHTETMFRPDEVEIGAAGKYPRSEMHKRYMGDVAIGKDHLLNFIFENQRFEFFFRIDGSTAGVERPAQ